LFASNQNDGSREAYHTQLMLRDANALTTDWNLVDETVNPGRLEKKEKASFLDN
jgi:hypothetical protein